MGDLLQQDVELVHRARALSPSEAARFLFDRYRISSVDSRDGLVLALIGALIASWQVGAHRHARFAGADVQRDGIVIGGEGSS